MAKKAKKGLALVAQRRQTRRRSVTANPPVGTDLLHSVLPGFGAYAATRLLSRIVYSLVQRKWPKLGKHAAALAATGAFGTAWLGAHRIQRLAPYHDVIVIGSGVAALQTIVRTYLPRYGWIVADPKPADVQPAALPAAAATAAAQAELQGDEYSYLEAELEQRTGTPMPQISDEDIAAVLGDDEEVEDLYTGTFAN